MACYTLCICMYMYTMYESINVGMDPMTKTELVESLFKVLMSAGILSVEPSKVMMMYN